MPKFKNLNPLTRTFSTARKILRDKKSYRRNLRKSYRICLILASRKTRSYNLDNCPINEKLLPLLLPVSDLKLS
jgi:hypothetical protein